MRKGDRVRLKLVELNQPEALRNHHLDLGVVIDSEENRGVLVRFDGSRQLFHCEKGSLDLIFSSEIFSAEDVVTLLRNEVYQEGSQVVADRIGCGTSYLNIVLQGKHRPGPKIQRYMGLRPLIVYVPGEVIEEQRFL